MTFVYFQMHFYLANLCTLKQESFSHFFAVLSNRENDFYSGVQKSEHVNYQISEGSDFQKRCPKFEGKKGLIRISQFSELQKQMSSIVCSDQSCHTAYPCLLYAVSPCLSSTNRRLVLGVLQPIMAEMSPRGRSCTQKC